MKAPLQLDIEWVFPSDEGHLAPDGMKDRAPVIDDPALLPQQGDVVMVGPRRAWLVVIRRFEWVSPDFLRIWIHLAHAPEQLALHPTPRPKLVEPLQATRPEGPQ